jgi:hypothetical protein
VWLEWRSVNQRRLGLAGAAWVGRRPGAAGWGRALAWCGGGLGVSVAGAGAWAWAWAWAA